MATQSCEIIYQSQKNREISYFHAFDFYLNSKSTCDLTDVLAAIFDINTAAWPFDTIDVIREQGG